MTLGEILEEIRSVYQESLHVPVSDITIKWSKPLEAPVLEMTLDPEE